ncbi:hypothetical protein IJF93_00980 [Candidatus Saccharibacteria bacterium]|nr:hypothetical protein [Candidatus Saccharibacteria bacterium]
MQDYQLDRLTNKLINLTDEPVCVYDETSGAIVEFAPDDNESCALCGSTIAHYVVTEEMFNPDKCSGCCLKNFAIVVGRSHGRNGVMISRLVWAEDLKKTVRLHPNAHKIMCLQG